jgi:dynactin-5
MDEPTQIEFAVPPLAAYGPLISRDVSLSQVVLSESEASTDYMSTKARNHIGTPSLVSGSVTCSSGRTFIAPNAKICGDNAPVQIGECCVIESNTVLEPCHEIIDGAAAYAPLVVGDLSIIEEGCRIEALSLGPLTHIMHDSVVGPRAVLAPCVRVLPHSRVPDGFVAPPFTILGGNPARVVGRLPPAAAAEQRARALAVYTRAELVLRARKASLEAQQQQLQQRFAAP